MAAAENMARLVDAARGPGVQRIEAAAPRPVDAGQAEQGDGQAPAAIVRAARVEPEPLGLYPARRRRRPI